MDLGDRPGAARAAARAVPDEIRTGFTRTIAGLLLVFGAVVPLVMFAPRFAALLWPVMPLAQLLAVRFSRPGRAPRGPT